jgi:hypothetical protein
MNNNYEDDWLEFIVNFVIAAILTWILVSLLYWKYGSYSSASEVLIAATISAVVVGVIAGIWRTGFWKFVQKLSALSPYSNRPKK